MSNCHKGPGSWIVVNHHSSIIDIFDHFWFLANLSIPENTVFISEMDIKSYGLYNGKNERADGLVWLFYNCDWSVATKILHSHWMI